MRNCVKLLDVSLSEAVRYASTEPAAFLGLSDRLGRLAPGYRADMVAFQPDTVSVLGTWLSGIWQASRLSLARARLADQAERGEAGAKWQETEDGNGER